MKFGEFVREQRLEREVALDFLAWLDGCLEMSGWEYMHQWSCYFQSLSIEERQRLVEARAEAQRKELAEWVRPEGFVRLRVHFGSSLFYVSRHSMWMAEVVVGCN